MSALCVYKCGLKAPWMYLERGTGRGLLDGAKDWIKLSWWFDNKRHHDSSSTSIRWAGRGQPLQPHITPWPYIR